MLIDSIGKSVSPFEEYSVYFHFSKISGVSGILDRFLRIINKKAPFHPERVLH